MPESTEHEISRPSKRARLVDPMVGSIAPSDTPPITDGSVSVCERVHPLPADKEHLASLVDFALAGLRDARLDIPTDVVFMCVVLLCRWGSWAASDIRDGLSAARLVQRMRQNAPHHPAPHDTTTLACYVRIVFICECDLPYMLAAAEEELSVDASVRLEMAYLNAESFEGRRAVPYTGSSTHGPDKRNRDSLCATNPSLIDWLVRWSSITGRGVVSGQIIHSSDGSREGNAIAAAMEVILQVLVPLDHTLNGAVCSKSVAPATDARLYSLVKTPIQLSAAMGIIAGSPPAKHVPVLDGLCYTDLSLARNIRAAGISLAEPLPWMDALPHDDSNTGNHWSAELSLRVLENTHLLESVGKLRTWLALGVVGWNACLTLARRMGAPIDDLHLLSAMEFGDLVE